jgi:hypothetical protein
MQLLTGSEIINIEFEVFQHPDLMMSLSSLRKFPFNSIILFEFLGFLKQVISGQKFYGDHKVEKAENILLTESGNTDYWTKYSEKQSDYTEGMSNLMFSKLTINLPFTYYSTSYPKTK